MKYVDKCELSDFNIDDLIFQTESLYKNIPTNFYSSQKEQLAKKIDEMSMDNSIKKNQKSQTRT